MFRVKQSEVDPRLSWAMLALVAAISAAALVTGWLTWMLYLERGMIADLLHGKAAQGSELIRALPKQLRWQSTLAVIVLMILVATAGALIVIRRAYLASRQTLREVKMLASDIFSSMIQGVVTTNCENTITSVNPRGCELLRIEVTCVGQEIETISLPDLPLAALSREVLAEQRPVTDRQFMLQRNGHTQRVQADCHLLRDTDGALLGTVLHMRDVTDRVLMEERMRRMERYMGLGSLAAGLHHEIKNPLTALSLHVQLLEEHMAAQARSVELNELIGVLKTEMTRLSGVLETFRDYAAMLTLAVQPTRVMDLIKKAVRLVRPQADLQKVTIHVPRSEATMPSVSLDPAKFEQVILNLIINGLEAMPHGGDLTIQAQTTDGHLRIEVADTGCGIAPDVQGSIFDPYFSTKNDGLGMGLAWSEKIVQQHQGDIDFETGPRGTVFRVTIPLTPRDG